MTPSCRTAVVAVTLAAAGLVVGRESAAQPASSGEPTSETRIREIRLPLLPERLADWIDENWVPFDAERFARLRPAVEARGTERQPPGRIHRTVYRASFAGTSLVNGRLEAEVGPATETAGDRLETVPLEPLNLAIDSLSWSSGAATWGTDGSGRMRLVVPPAGGTLSGSWRRDGRALPGGVEFELHLLPADVSQLHLELPAGHVVDCRTAVVTPPEQAESGGIWRIDAGPEPKLRLRVERADDTARRTLVAHSSSVTYVAHRSEVRFRADVTFEVFDGTVAAAVLESPEDVVVDSVTYGEDVPVEWSLARKRGTLRVTLPDAVGGRLRPLVVRGSLPLPQSEPWRVPGWDVTRVAAPDGATTTLVFAGGRIDVSTVSPSVLSVVSTNGCRRVSPAAEEGGGEAAGFERYEPGAAPTLVVAPPERDLRAVSANLVDATSDEWALRSRVEWTARSGRAFRLRVRIPEGWQLSTVELAGDPSAALPWTVERVEEERPVAVVELANSLAPGQPRSVRFECRRLPVPEENVVRGPAVVPLDCSHVETVVALRTPPGLVAESMSPTTFETDTIADRDEFLAAVGAEAFTGDGDARFTALRSQALDPRGAVRLRPQSERLDADVTVEVEPGSHGPQVRYEVAVEPHDTSLDGVVLYSTGDFPGDWSLVESPSSVVVPRTLDDAERERYGLPQTGAAWELRLPERRSRPFVLQARGPAAANEDGAATVPLLVVPRAREIGGRLRVSPAVSIAYDLSATGPWSHEATGDDDGTGRGDRFQSRYESTSSRLVLRPRDEADENDAPPTVEVTLTTTLSGGESGDANCVARYEFEKPTAGELSLRLPAEAGLGQCLVDRRFVPVRGEPGGVIVVPIPRTAAGNVVEVRYRLVGAVRSALWQRLDAVVPECGARIASFQWTVRTPPRLVPAGDPPGAFWAEPVPEPTWLERLFGPLGRRGERGVFNPFLAETWSSSRDANEGGGSRSAWNTFTGTAFEPDRAPSAILVDTRLRDSLAWSLLAFCALGGAVVRRRQARFRIAGGTVLLASGVAGAVLLPPALAPIGGGMIAGTLVASLFPRRLLRRRRPRSVENGSISTGSTLSFEHALPLLLGAAILAAAAGMVRAQSESRSDSPSSTPDGGKAEPATGDLAVLVPSGADGSRSPVVYVTKALAERLHEAESASPAGPEFLVTSSRYKALLTGDGSPAVVATFRVQPLVRGERVVVRLPLSGANLGGERACLVDGVETPVRWSPDRRFLEVEVERSSDETVAREAFDVEFQLHPSVTTSPEGARGFRVGILPVADARLLVQAEPGIRLLDLGRGNGNGAGNERRRPQEFRLGPVDELVCRWSSAGELVATRSQAEVAATSIVQVSPSLLRWRCRADVRVTRGRLPALRWRLPPHAGVRSVVASEPVQHEVEYASGETTDLVVVPQVAVDDELTVEVEFLLPTMHDGEDLVLPSLAFEAGTDAAAANVEDVSVADYRVAVAASSEFELLRPIVAGMHELESVPVEDPATAFPQWSGPGPTFAFRGESPGPVRVRLKPREPVRRVRQSLECRLQPDRVDWTLVAEVEVSEAPVFGHVLHVDERAVIEDVSVDQGGAERLARWARDGRTVQLVLRGRFVGQHRLVVTGRTPIEEDGPLRLPVVHLGDAAVTGATVVVQHPTSVDVAFADEDDASELRRLQGPLEGPNRPDRETFGRFALDDPTREIRLRVEREPAQLDVEATSVLARRGGRVRQLATRLVVRASRGAVEDVHVGLPQDYPVRYSLTTSPLARTVVSDDPAGRDLVVKPDGGDVDELEITLVADVTPDGETEWTLPLPNLLSPVASSSHRLVVADDEWRPESLERLDPSGEPSRWRELVGEAGPIPWGRTRVYDVAEGRMSLSRPAERVRDEREHAMLLETRLLLTDDGLAGSTVAVTAGPTTQPLAFDVPAGTEFRRLFVDGREAEAELPEAGRRPTLTFDDDAVHVIRLEWTRPLPFAALPFRRELPLVRPRGIEPALELCSVAAAGALRPQASSSLAVVDRADYELRRLEALAEAVAEADTADRDLLRSLAREVRDLRDRTRSHAISSDRTRSATERLDELLAKLPDVENGFRSSGNAAAVRERLFGPVVREPNLHAIVDTGGDAVTIWTLHTWWAAAVGLLVLFLAAVPLVGRFVALDVANRVHAHLPVSLAALGVVWWTCLRPSWLGPLLLIAAAALVARRLVRRVRNPEVAV